MKKVIVAVMFVSSLTMTAQYNTANLRVRETEVPGFTYKNLQLFPIYANQVFLNSHKDIGKFTTLQKSLEEKKVKITEVDGTQNRSSQAQDYESSGSVNTLCVENISSDTIVVMAGEVVKGGKQDRVLAQDMILLPKSGKKYISVFCVEHGRWTYSEDSKKANNTFHGYSNVSSANIRKVAVVDKNQQTVWNNVSEITSKNSASNRTDTYTALDTSLKLNTELKTYSQHFKSALKAQANVIGVVACTGTKIIGCDMFASPAMFNQYIDNLLNSYATEAISNGAPAKVSHEAVRTYLNKILSDEKNQEKEVEKNGTFLKTGDKKLHIATF